MRLLKARVIRTLISAVMSSLLYQLSYNLKSFLFKLTKLSLVIINIKKKNTDIGFAPICTGHEPIMLLFTSIRIKNKKNSVVASVGFEPTHVTMKTLCLNHLTIRPIYV